MLEFKWAGCEFEMNHLLQICEQRNVFIRLQGSRVAKYRSISELLIMLPEQASFRFPCTRSNLFLCSWGNDFTQLKQDCDQSSLMDWEWYLGCCSLWRTRIITSFLMIIKAEKGELWLKCVNQRIVRSQAFSWWDPAWLWRYRPATKVFGRRCDVFNPPRWCYGYYVTMYWCEVIS